MGVLNYKILIIDDDAGERGGQVLKYKIMIIYYDAYDPLFCVAVRPKKSTQKRRMLRG
jgi:hypothetical protein